MIIIGGYSYLIVGISFIFLLLLLTTTGLKTFNSKILFAAILSSALWSFYLYLIMIDDASVYYIFLCELLKNTLWGLLCISLLTKCNNLIGLFKLNHQLNWFYWIPAIAIAINIGFSSQFITNPLWLFLTQLVQAIALLVMVEFLYRQGSFDFRWGFKPFAFCISAIAIFDFILYSTAILLQKIDSNLFAVRAILQLLLVPILLIGIKRFKSLGIRIFISREIVFHSTLLIGLSLYLTLMAITGYYLNYVGETWSIYSQLAFAFLALFILALLFINESIRRNIKVFISKNFFANRYDYRQQWLSLNNCLKSPATDNFYHTALLALTKLFEIEAGIIFTVNQSMSAKATIGEPNSIPLWGDCLSQYQKNHSQWIVDLDEYERYPDIYPEPLSFIEQLDQQPLKIIVPIHNDDKIYGYFVLSRPSHKELLNYEDRDLLITASQQLAHYLVLNEASIALSEAKQFDAFNQMSAFLVHDLKNVVGQLSLISSNAKKHRDNPEFIDDAFETVENSSQKINKMLNQLRQKNPSSDDNQQTDIVPLLHDVSADYQITPPLCHDQQSVSVSLDSNKLHNILGHLIQNAQQAIGKNGKVDLHLEDDQLHWIISVIDNGSGMTQEFIENRLFKPFDTTKGNAGMGIGAYEAKYFVESLGGHIKVASTINKGTKISLAIPKVTSAGSE